MVSHYVNQNQASCTFFAGLNVPYSYKSRGSSMWVEKREKERLIDMYFLYTYNIYIYIYIHMYVYTTLHFIRVYIYIYTHTCIMHMVYVCTWRERQGETESERAREKERKRERESERLTVKGIGYRSLEPRTRCQGYGWRLPQWRCKKQSSRALGWIQRPYILGFTWSWSEVFRGFSRVLLEDCK